VFDVLVCNKTLRFLLLKDDVGYRLPSKIIIRTGARRLAREDNTQLELSLFEHVPEDAFNTEERSVAWYFEKQAQLLWWYRNLSRRDYRIQGWRQHKIYPDFIVSHTSEVDATDFDKVFVVETKGIHLKNEDTDYKKKVFKLCNRLAEAKSWTELGLEFPERKIVFELVFGDEWQRVLNSLLKGGEAFTEKRGSLVIVTTWLRANRSAYVSPLIIRANSRPFAVPLYPPAHPALAEPISLRIVRNGRARWRMKSWVVGVASLFLFSVGGVSLHAADAPRGELLELHSCQLYIGGCIASSESTQEGQYLLCVWNFSDGSYDGTSLRGLTAALLEVSDQNLATKGARTVESIVYLPQSATVAQANAMIGWLKAGNPELGQTRLRTRTLPMEFSRRDNIVSFSAGDTLRIETTPFQPCGLVSCGEALWYTPRSAVSSYTVGVTSKAVVCEPALALKWIDHGKNNIFEGRFGDDSSARAAFVPPTFACVVANHPSHE